MGGSSGQTSGLPTRCSVSKQPVVQQFGMEAFVLPESEVCTEVTVVFEESFASEHYVIVGMSNDRGFQISLLSQSEDEAVLEVSRTADCKHTYGLLSWIAAGPSSRIVPIVVSVIHK
ncbi:WIAG-tail domain [Paenibacillus amylolyticus]|nr:WIAG-tail domain [Paenibacillus amylolyticus]